MFAVPADTVIAEVPTEVNTSAVLLAVEAVKPPALNAVSPFTKPAKPTVRAGLASPYTLVALAAVAVKGALLITRLPGAYVIA